MEFHMIEKFKRLLKDGHWPVSSQGILISLDDSEDSFDSAAEDDDEKYLNGIFCSHSLSSHNPNFLRHECSQAQIKQLLIKEMHEREKHAQQAAKNEAELLQEEEEEKLREERRKERKHRKKERKKAEKQILKGRNSNEIGAHKNSQFYNNNEEIKNHVRAARDESSAPEAVQSDEEENEGFLDVNSAFVTKLVKHKLRNNVNNTGHTKGNCGMNPSQGNSASTIKQSSNGTRIVPIPEKNILLGERLAVAGYQYASKENYDEAIQLFTRALRNVPNDHRYWGNRSFCYFQIGAYQMALEDADCAIQLAPNSPKGHYRRAEALAGLKDLVAAENSFEKVLELDVDCKDACDELLNIRMLRISEMGFDKKQAKYALKKHISLEVAVEALMNNENFDVESDEEIDLVYESDEDINWDNVGVMEDYIDNQENNLFSQKPPETQNIENSQSSFVEEVFQAPNIESNFETYENKISKEQAATDPSNPNRCITIWVGNIEDSVPEKTLNDAFSRFGEINSIKMLHHCAFINFKDSKAPGPAMAAMQGKELAGKKLKIRYPNKTKEEQHIHQQMLCHQKRWQSALDENEPESAGAAGGIRFASISSTSNTKTTLVPTTKGSRTKLKGPVNGDECYYWRTTGCAFGDNCRNKHVKENREIDRKPWHK